jgi:hypothetical protein
MAETTFVQGSGHVTTAAPGLLYPESETARIIQEATAAMRMYAAVPTILSPPTTQPTTGTQ